MLRAPFSISIGCGMFLLVFAALITPALAQDYRLFIEDLEVRSGENFTLDLQGEWSAPVAGFSLSVAFPANPSIDGLDLVIDGTLVDELHPEFVEANVFPAEGEAVIGVLFDLYPPYDGEVLPVLGIPVALARFVGTVSADAPEEELLFEFVDGLGDPPINNVFVVDVQSIPADEMTGGVLRISSEPNFIRGDVTMDRNIDIADAIYHLNYTFSGGPQPICDDAADANDDGNADISDAIYILYYTFVQGPPPPPPFPEPGPDLTPDDLGCEEPLE